MTLPLAQKPSSSAADVVAHYLMTKQGMATPLPVRARLMVIDWRAIGASAVPSLEQVHYTRCWLEDQRLDEARLELAFVRAARAACADADDTLAPFER